MRNIGIKALVGLSQLQMLNTNNKMMHILIIASIPLYLLVSRSEDQVPERRTHTEACLFSAEMVLVVVLLKAVEVAAFGF